MDNLKVGRRSFLWGLTGLCTTFLIPYNHSKMTTFRAEGDICSDLFLKFWYRKYKKVNPHFQLNYSSIYNEATIIDNLEKGDLNFAVSNSVFSAQKIDGLYAKNIILLPINLGAIALIYNNKDIDNLKLNQQQVIDIFSGKINHWEQLGVKSNKPIQTVYQTNRSGINSYFNGYLKDINYSENVIKDDSNKNTKIGMGAKGNRGIISTVKQIDGAISYVEYSSLRHLNRVQIAQLQNKSNNFISPDIISQKILNEHLINSYIKQNTNQNYEPSDYPLITLNWLLINKNNLNIQAKTVLKDFVCWTVNQNHGQKYLSSLGYAPLTPSLSQKITAQIIQELII